MHDGHSVTTTSAPVEATFSIFRARIAADTSGLRTLYEPAAPQQRSASGSSRNSTPGSERSRSRGWLTTPWQRAPRWHGSWNVTTVSYTHLTLPTILRV